MMQPLAMLFYSCLVGGSENQYGMWFPYNIFFWNEEAKYST